MVAHGMYDIAGQHPWNRLSRRRLSQAINGILMMGRWSLPRAILINHEIDAFSDAMVNRGRRNVVAGPGCDAVYALSLR